MSASEAVVQCGQCYDADAFSRVHCCNACNGIVYQSPFDYATPFSAGLPAAFIVRRFAIERSRHVATPSLPVTSHVTVAARRLYLPDAAAFIGYGMPALPPFVIHTIH